MINWEYLSELVFISITLVSIIMSVVLLLQRRVLLNKIKMQQLQVNYQRQLLRSAIDSQEIQRKKIALDLHDVVGAMLSATKLNLNMLTSGTIPAQEVGDTLGQTKKMMDETIDTVRNISKELLPYSLEKFGLAKALKELCEKQDSHQTRVHFHEYGDTISLQKAEELQVFRITEELVGNALKHAKASEVNVELDWKIPVVLTVKDNGKGINLLDYQEVSHKSVGLYNVENRMSLIQGEINVESKEGEGSTIKIIIKKDI